MVLNPWVLYMRLSVWWLANEATTRHRTFSLVTTGGSAVTLPLGILITVCRN